MSRRDFLAVSLGGMALGAGLGCTQQNHASGIPRRPLGQTGEMVSIIGVGGWDIGNIKDTREAVAIMRAAIDEGINFFDNCWDYHHGHSEEVMGRALAGGGWRDQVFLMTKVCARDYRGSMRHLEESLRRLRTDRLDLWQFHGIQWPDDPDLIFDEKNGALRAALEARKAGKVRYIGFTGHKDPDFHLAMLERPFAWEAVQMPLNVLDAHYRSFQQLVLPECTKRGIGVLGMKALAAQDGILVRKLGLDATLARRYVLSLPVSSLVCGMQSRENLRQDVAMARTFTPVTPEEIQALAAKVEASARDGSLEGYKVGNYGCDWHHEQGRSERETGANAAPG